MDYGRYDFTALFMPSNEMDHLTWLSSHSGAIKGEDLCDQEVGGDIGLIRDLGNNRTPHMFQGVRYASLEDTFTNGTTKALQHQNSELFLEDRGYCQPSEGVPDCSMHLDRADRDDQCVLLEVKRLPKRADFLHPVPRGNASSARKYRTQWLHANKCEVDKLPFSYSRFALFVPSILHKIQVAMTVELLCNTVLSSIQFRDRSLVTTAISASSAHEGTNYERLETLGDSVLKYMTSLTLMAEHLNYHEGIRTYFWHPYFLLCIVLSLETWIRSAHCLELFQESIYPFKQAVLTLRYDAVSHKKDHIVSNSSLANAAMRTGMDRFIITKPFTGQKWRPLYNGNLAANKPGPTREMSTKTLADVVEALMYVFSESIPL